ncbi:MAG TPA: hypothetical protein VGQ36_25005 [Thermoanaerobaculia bacterium]|jgi:antitoxin component of MazEF toxin-antitoxin module|nr:hypothetical protein [Thermoanaerobaculia bacterium]
MKKKKTKIPAELQIWIDARKRFHLSHAHVQMARELGMNPKKLGGLANHDQEPWKAPLPVFVEDLYERRFGRRSPERVISIEERAAEIAAKKAARREERAARRASEHAPGEGTNMKKKLTRIEEGVALIIDEMLLEQLGLGENSEVALVIRDGSLLVIPETKRDRIFRESMENVDEQYSEVFRRLADS